MNNNIFSTLQGLLQSDSGNKVLQLAQNQFSGPIQSAIGDYLNGISLQLGAATLTVNSSTQQLNLQAPLDGGNLDLKATTNGATLTLSDSQYPDAQVVLSFTQVDSGVQLELNATMGSSLQWPLQAIWPSLLNWSPANQMQFAKGALDLQLTQESVDFSGRGSLLYSGQDFANAAVSVQYDGRSTGILFGVAVQQWSPGSLWPPLSALTFKDSGIVVSTLNATSGSLVSLGLLSAQDVPAIQADFDIQPGYLLFTSLQLTDSLQALANFMGSVSELDMFGSYASGSGDTTLKAVLTDSFSAQDNGIFEFGGFALEWDDVSQGDSTITASATGTFRPDAQTAIDLSLTGSITPAEGDLSLTFELRNWNQPFGLSTVDIEDLKGTVVIGAEAGGVTLGFGGEIKLQNPNAPQYEFEIGFEIEVVDFEAPNGIALWTQADQEPMTLSNVLDAAFALDFSPQAFDNAGEPEVGAVVGFADDLINVKQFTFWFVEGASLQKIGDHGPFPAGFGLQSQFELLNQEDVQVSVTLAEQANASAGFTGEILLQEPVKWGSVFSLSGWDEQGGKPSTQGPQFAIAATPAGIVIPGVNDGEPVRFYSSLYLDFLDVVSDSLYALATNDNQFALNYSVQEGVSAGDCGTWGGDSIQFALNPSTYQFSAAFSFDFGWTNVTWGGITLWDVTLVPSISLPDFNIAAGLSLSASIHQLLVTGYFDFDLFGIHLSLGDANNPYTLLNVDIDGIIAKLNDIADQLLNVIKQQSSNLLQAALQTFDNFLAWAKLYWQYFVNGLELIAMILRNTFNKVEEELAGLLKDLGAAAAEVQTVLLALGYALEDIVNWLGDVFGCPISKASNMLPSV